MDSFSRPVLTNAQHVVCRRDFESFDTDKSKLLERKEIPKLLTKQLERKPTKSEIQSFMHENDMNKDGKVSLVEYITSIFGKDWRMDGDMARCGACASALAPVPAAFVTKMGDEWITCDGCDHEELLKQFVSAGIMMCEQCDYGLCGGCIDGESADLCPKALHKNGRHNSGKNSHNMQQEWGANSHNSRVPGCKVSFVEIEGYCAHCHLPLLI